MAECNAVGYLPPIVEETANNGIHDDNDNDNDNTDDDDNHQNQTLNDSSKKKLEILMSFDKHKTQTPTLDTFVIKTTTSSTSVAPIIPKKKEINLDDPKFKTKDIKPKKTSKTNATITDLS